MTATPATPVPGRETRSVRFVNAAQRATAATAAAAAAAGSAPAAAAGVDGDPASGWRPEVWLGAPAPGGLALPSAHPTASWLYAPRGVHLGRTRAGTEVLLAADTGNHRVLLWHGLPTADEQPCDVVLGQPDPTTEGPAAGGLGPRTGMYLPTGVLLHDDLLVVADAWHHRVLVYDGLPQGPGAEPALVLGQAGPDQVLPNRGAETAALDSLYWPFGIAVVAGAFWVADTGNRRVLGWTGGIPRSADLPPDVVLGQPDAVHREENRGADPGPDSFRWPHDLTGTDDLLLVADAGNHRLLGWTPPPAPAPADGGRGDRPADRVLGQPSFTAAEEWPYAPQRGEAFRFPYAADLDGGRLAVADTANNRVLLWDGVPGTGPQDVEGGPAGVGRGPDAVLGQPSFASNGENRWTGVDRDTFCWPYGLSLRGDRLAVADSGNNRVVLWRRDPPTPVTSAPGAAGEPG